jgi:hypothetical protein
MTERKEEEKTKTYVNKEVAHKTVKKIGANVTNLLNEITNQIGIIQTYTTEISDMDLLHFITAELLLYKSKLNTVNDMFLICVTMLTVKESVNRSLEKLLEDARK